MLAYSGHHPGCISRIFMLKIPGMKLKNGKLNFLSGRETLHFSPGDIVRLEALSNYTCVHFISHKPIITATLLKDYEKALQPYGFVRVHRSHLINKKYVTGINDNGIITMTDRSTASISRRKKNKAIVVLMPGRNEETANDHVRALSITDVV